MVKKKTKSSKKLSSKKKAVRKVKKMPAKSNVVTINKNLLIGIGAFILVVAVVWGLMSSPNVIPTKTTTKTSGDQKASFDMYVMSQCPYGVQAETAAINAIKKFNGEVGLNIHYIVDSQGDSFRSLHGPNEVNENLRQVCIQELYPEKFDDYLLCFNENYQAGDTQYATCSSKLGLDATSIADCVDTKATDLLKASEAQTKKVGATGSPTIYLDGEPYQSGRSELDFARAVCEKYDYELDGCADIPKPVDVQVTIVTDSGCPSCDTSQIKSVTKQLFPGATFTTIQFDSEEGKKLVDANSLEYLPAYIFDSNLEKTNTWKTNTDIKSAFTTADGGYRLLDQATGAKWFVSEEKRQAYQEILKNYPKKNLETLGYTSDKPRLDYFVMAFCPYGNPAEEAAAQVYTLLGDKVEIVPHYILGVSGTTLNSLHGVQEGNQGVRELCVLNNFGIQKFFDFTLKANQLCSSANADTCWESAATQSGVDVQAVKNCESSQKLALAQGQSDLNNKLLTLYRGSLTVPSASPTFLINGETYSGARDADSLKNALCAKFTGSAPAECSQVINTAVASQTAATTATASQGSC